jgi:transcriptional regulator with XRE-family HTH domain
MRMRRVARTLLHWRESRGLSGTDIAKQAGWSASKQSRLENAIQPIQPAEVITLALLFGVPEAERDAVFSWCVAAQKKGWWDEVSEEALVADSVDYFEFESEASAVRTFKVDLVPGLMQTAAYAAAVETAGLPQVSAEVVRERVEARIKRQERLNGEKPIHVQAVLTEGVLRSQVGGPEVMQEQLGRLTQLSMLPNVDLRVIAATGAYPAMGKPFNILSFAHAYPDVGYVELVDGGVYIEEPEVLERYEMSFEGVKSVSLDPNRSRNLIAEITQSLS